MIVYLKTKSFVNPNSVNLFIKIPHSNDKFLKLFVLENLKLLLGFEWGTYLISEIATTNNKTRLCGWLCGLSSSSYAHSFLLKSPIPQIRKPDSKPSFFSGLYLIWKAGSKNSFFLFQICKADSKTLFSFSKICTPVTRMSPFFHFPKSVHQIENLFFFHPKLFLSPNL